MNYVQHTRAAHERLLHEPAARTQHYALYWVLFFEWNAARFPAVLPIDRAAVMVAARIGNRDTYTATLRALESFGLLTYRPSHSTNGSTVTLTKLGGEVAAEVGQPTVGSCRTGGPTKTTEVAAQVSQLVAAEVGQPSLEVAAQVGQHSLLVKTPSSKHVLNSGGSAEKKRGRGEEEGGSSGVEIIDGTGASDEPVPGPASAPKKKVAPKKKGGGKELVGAAATAQSEGTRRRPERQQRPEVEFSKSELATYEAFAAAFAGTDYELADLRFYHEKILNWRQKGEVPRRRDWRATATQFFLNDAHDNRLKLAPGVQRHEPGTGPDPTKPGIPTTGYRSSRWD